MRIGIDITSAIRQDAGIGRFTRELIRALMALDEGMGMPSPHQHGRMSSPHEYALFAATGGLPRATTESRLAYITQLASPHRRLEFCDLKFLSDDWLHRIWHRARLPIPIEAMMGRVDLFHEPDFVLPPTLPRAHTVLTVHDLTFVRDPESAFPKLRRYLNRVVPRSVQRATHVLADSAATRSDLVELFGAPADKITVLYGGVDARFAPVQNPERLSAVRAKYNIGPGPFILGLGTLQPRKNYRRLIQAFANLQPPALRASRPSGIQPLTSNLQPPTSNLQPPALRASNLRLVIVGGKGWMYDSIFAEVKRLGLERHVLFPGFVDDDDLPALYSAAEMLAYPSLYEGFGLPVLEAMACGAPVVTSNVSSLPEVAGEAALQIEPTDVGAIANAMLRLLQDADLRRELVNRGFDQARKFTWEKAATQLLEIYESVSAV